MLQGRSGLGDEPGKVIPLCLVREGVEVCCAMSQGQGKQGDGEKGEGVCEGTAVGRSAGSLNTGKIFSLNV